MDQFSNLDFRDLDFLENREPTNMGANNFSTETVVEMIDSRSDNDFLNIGNSSDGCVGLKNAEELLYSVINQENVRILKENHGHEVPFTSTS